MNPTATSFDPAIRPFVALEPRHGRLATLGTAKQGLRLSAWSAGRLSLAGGATHFGFVQDQAAKLVCESGSFELGPSMYFCVPGRLTIEGAGSGILVSQLAYRGFFHLGGPIEPHGRLRYIDGCTDSLLIPPVVLGDPCLNLLHIPRRVRQSAHTHPSDRIGLVVRGRGRCVTPVAEFPLAAGLPFVIPAGARHGFHTAGSSLTVIAFHPDSDFGPQHENHPMLNRTILVS